MISGVGVFVYPAPNKLTPLYNGSVLINRVEVIAISSLR